MYAFQHFVKKNGIPALRVDFLPSLAKTWWNMQPRQVIIKSQACVLNFAWEKYQQPALPRVD